LIVDTTESCMERTRIGSVQNKEIIKKYVDLGIIKKFKATNDRNRHVDVF